MAVIRPTHLGEEHVLQEIEVLAGKQFREIGLPEVADDEPASVQTLAGYAQNGRSWVVLDPADLPVDHVHGWAGERGLSAITLTTFVEVPWNAPLYRHLGFQELPEDEIGPELRAVRAKETAHDLDPTKRICMRAELHSCDRGS